MSAVRGTPTQEASLLPLLEFQDHSNSDSSQSHQQKEARVKRHLALTVLVMLLSPIHSRADEGMWLFNDLPLASLKEKYSFEPSQDWIDRVSQAAIRFNSGGSGSFVSSKGLVLTNHHVGADVLHKLSTSENDYYEDGYYAGTLEEELQAPDLELNQLVSIEDVTDKVLSAVQSGMSTAKSHAARQAVVAEIEKNSFDQTGLRSDVVTLYRGGAYHLYRYKRYTDVRLVFAPEAAIAAFGGDPDNFEYPRYCLDACFFRVYESGKPANIKHFLKWSGSGAKKGELIFVSGHPGRTSRLYTTDALTFLRDARLPYTLNILRRWEVLLQQYGFEGEEQTRRAKDELLSIQNSRKALSGMLQGLQNPELILTKKNSERELRKQIKADPQLRSHIDAWDRIASAQKHYATLMRKRALLEIGMAFRSNLFTMARTLVRMASEDQKPNSERLAEYRESGRPSLEQRLFSAAPIHKDLERVKLADSLALLTEGLGGDYPLVQKILDGRSPRARAADLIDNSHLHNVAKRKELAEAGASAIASSQDPMIRLARLVDPESRALRKAYEEDVQEVERQAYAGISDAMFALRGTSTYPDATFTLRLSFGTISGYKEGGTRIPAWTTLGGAFEHEAKHGKEKPWRLPDLWHEKKDELDLSTPFNFVSTADIIGGNSGSPVVNRKGELVGLIFDGNIYSLTADYLYTAELARATSVHSSAIRESLETVYQADRILKELGQ